MNEPVTLTVPSTWTPEQLHLITSTIAKGATPDELKLFLYRCQNLGLDPLKPGQIYFIKYGNSPGTIVIGIEGFRSRAARNGKLSGIKRGAIHNDKGILTGAWAEVYRSDWKECAREEVALAEYNTGKGSWAKLPETMIKKVAEAAALRMAFPDDLGGVYTKEEMEQAGPDGSTSYTPGPSLPKIYPEQPGSTDGSQDSEYRIPFGKFRGRSLSEVGADELMGYVEYIEQKALTDNKPINNTDTIQFIEKAKFFIDTCSFTNDAAE